MAIVIVQDITPPSGSAILADTPILVDVKSATAFVRIILAFRFAGFDWQEVAYAQDPASGSATTFEPFYQASSMSVIAEFGFFRYHFSLRRTPVWPDSPELIVYAFNLDGQEA